MARVVLAALLLALAACRQIVGIEDREPLGDAPFASTKVDLLLVVDDTVGMADAQDALAEAFRTDFVSYLLARTGSLPDMHVGVIGTSVSVGYPVGGCGDVRDRGDGLLRLGAGDTCDAPPSGERFYSTAPASTDDLGAAVACAVRLGTQGCAFRQPLEAVRLALDGSRPENQGFLRPDALLAIVFLASGDDCSARDRTIFDPSPALTKELGPLTPFRCTRFGISCPPVGDVDQAARYADCGSDESSPYLATVRSYVDFLHGLKGTRNAVVALALVGPGDSISVSATGAGLELEPTCEAGSTRATPGIRLGELVDGFEHAETASICRPLVSPLLELAARIDLLIAR